MGNYWGSYAQLTCSALETSNLPAQFICQFSTTSKYADVSTGRQEQPCVQPLLVVAGRGPKVGRRITIQGQEWAFVLLPHEVPILPHNCRKKWARLHISQPQHPKRRFRKFVLGRNSEVLFIIKKKTLKLGFTVLLCSLYLLPCQCLLMHVFYATESLIIYNSYSFFS